MTEQVPDTCTIDGQVWSIDEWEGPFDLIPDNQLLGFKTISRSTANWAGRIDHFLVFKDQLYLFKIEVELEDNDEKVVPTGARQEVQTIYEPLTVCDENGTHQKVRVHEHRYFIFDDLKIKLTGTLRLSFPIWDPWNYPWPLDEDDIEPSQEAVVTFKDGYLVDVELWDV